MRFSRNIINSTIKKHIILFSIYSCGFPKDQVNPTTIRPNEKVQKGKYCIGKSNPYFNFLPLDGDCLNVN